MEDTDLCTLMTLMYYGKTKHLRSLNRNTEINVQKVKYVFMLCDNLEKSQNTTVDKFFEIVSYFKYFRMKITNKMIFMMKLREMCVNIQFRILLSSYFRWLSSGL
jgi:hypothetical protein